MSDFGPDGGGDLGPDVNFPPGPSGEGPATSYSATLSASSEAEGTPVTITYVANGTGTQTITPSVSGIMGTFSPATIALNGTTPVTQSFTPTSIGTGTISFTNSGSLTDPPDDTDVSVTPSGGITPGTTYLWQFTYQGDITNFLDGFEFSVAYLVYDFFGNATPTPGSATSILLVDSLGNQTAPLSIIYSSSPPAGQQIILATFPAMAKGSYLVVTEVELYGAVWSATPDRISVQ